MAYKTAIDARRRNILDQITAESQEYDPDYASP